MAESPRFHKVLVAVDGSPVSLRAVDHAARIARYEDAELVAVHIVAQPPVDLPGEAADYFEHARQSARPWLKEVEERATRQGRRLRTEVVVGAVSAADAILAFAEAERADLIVTGTRGRTRSRRIVVGSVASALVEYASCPVMVIR